MGVFYDVEVEVPLEDLTDSERDGIWWQSKTFNGWGTVVITREGRLFEYEYETVPEDERPYCKGKKPEERDALDKLCGSIRRIPLRPQDDKNYHGDFNFYGSSEDVKNDEWFEYIARFSDGQLQWVKRFAEHQKPPQKGDESGTEK